MGLFNLLLGGGPNETVKSLIEQGASIIDVRSESEFNSGHVSGSINIPLNEISKQMDKIKNIEGPIVLCCASGNRSGQAMGSLQSSGIECVNGGGWKQVNQYVV